MPNIDLSILNQRQTPAFYADVFANRPAAGFIGRIFVSTNTFAFYRDNGTSWDLIGGPGTGTITGSGSSGSLALWNGTNTITYDVAITWNGTDNSISADKFIVNSGTSSQFLKANGSLDSNTYNTGSGAVGQVTFWNGTNVITGGNDLFWDATNGHLGVNTNAPGTALDVHHDQSTVAILNQTVATNDVRIGFQNNGVGLWRIGAFYNAGANDFGIYDAVAAIQPVTVKKNTGQVLIGTSTVGSGKLVVASATGDNGIQIVGATAPSLRIDSAESGPTKRAGLGISTATNNFIQGSADRDFCIFNGSTTVESPILFGIYAIGAGNVQEAARISAARNFLIGTTTDAGQKLQVNGNSQFTGVSFFNRGTLAFTLNPSYAGGNVYSQLQSTGNLALATGGDSNKVYITSGTGWGVGIGTDTPLVACNVIGNVRAGYTNSVGLTIGLSPVGVPNNDVCSYILWGDSASFGGENGDMIYIPRTSTTAKHRWYTGFGLATEKMTLTLGGNLLIGTTTDAGQKLQVNGNATIKDTVRVTASSTTSVSTSATIISTASNTYGGLAIVWGVDGSGNIWTNLIFYSLGTVLVLASQDVSGGPDGRTYSVDGSGNLRLAMAAGTYTVRYQALLTS